MTQNIQYEALTGSVAYGVTSDTSDIDVVGWTIPTKEVIFPHIAGFIPNFGKGPPEFNQFQQHRINDVGAEKIYDITIYSIVRYFQLCMECNPNMIDTLYTPQNCILYISQIGQIVRDNRHLFLHKGAYHKFTGYAYSQLHKMGSQTREGKRAEVVEKYGFDLKFAYHLARLADECEQILGTCNLDLQRSKEYLKAIRRGEVTEAEIRAKFAEKEKTLETLYRESKLPHSPDEEKIKQLLLKCLEQHYGSLEKCVVNVDSATQTLREVKELLEKRGY